MNAKLSPTMVQEQTKKVQDVVEKLKRENKGEHFTAVTPEQIKRKLTGRRSWTSRS